MRQYTVEWEPDAEIDLGDSYLRAADPAAVTAAQALADRLLEQDPFGNGQHLSEGLYEIRVPPLTLFYSVDTGQRMVEVSRVWYTP